MSDKIVIPSINAEVNKEAEAECGISRCGAGSGGCSSGSCGEVELKPLSETTIITMSKGEIKLNFGNLIDENRKYTVAEVYLLGLPTEDEYYEMVEIRPDILLLPVVHYLPKQTKETGVTYMERRIVDKKIAGMEAPMNTSKASSELEFECYNTVTLKFKPFSGIK